MFHRPGPGRPKGSLNKTEPSVRAAARAIVEDPEYRLALKLRVSLGEAPGMEMLLWHYAYGKPKETVEVVRGPSEFDAMTPEQLRARSLELAAMASELLQSEQGEAVH